MRKWVFIIGVIIVGIGTFFVLYNREDQSEVVPSGQTPNQGETTFTTQKIVLKDGSEFTLTLPKDYSITPVHEGFTNPRFMAVSPDKRLFVTDIYNAGDNTIGRIFVLDDFNELTKQFEQVTPYLQNLRNPNSIAFYEDRDNVTWLYVALTDKLVRYRYAFGSTTPQGKAETILTFPSGVARGGHTTRTIAFHNDKVYVSVGSSCNSCEEIIPERASILEMDPDGNNVRFYAKGLRNAVGLKWIGNDLFVTNMGVDHLGDDLPNDTFYKIRPGNNYGWPYCYASNGNIFEDSTKQWENQLVACALVPIPDTEFSAHSAPLGFELFDASFLVALHGSSNSNIGAGYKIVQITEENTVADFITGFLQEKEIYGRPVDILKNNESSFFFTDDYKGVLYFVTSNK